MSEITVTLSVDEWDLIKQLLRGELDPKAWRTEIDYILEEVEDARIEAVI